MCFFIKMVFMQYLKLLWHFEVTAGIDCKLSLFDGKINSTKLIMYLFSGSLVFFFAGRRGCN